MKVKEIKQLLKNLKDEDEIYCVNYNSDELHFELYTEEHLIDMANNQAGYEDFEDDENVKPISDVYTAIDYILEFDDDINIME